MNKYIEMKKEVKRLLDKYYITKSRLLAKNVIESYSNSEEQNFVNFIETALNALSEDEKNIILNVFIYQKYSYQLEGYSNYQCNKFLTSAINKLYQIVI